MNKETRIQNIERSRNEPDSLIGEIEIPWKDELKPMKIYKVPLEYLVYNKYNGRILSRTKSLESQHRKIDVESEAGKNLIEDLLYKSNEGRNDKTLTSIQKLGQQKPGIITKDGIIIDGNRRAYLLKKSKKYNYFKTVILPLTLEENPLEIEKLETSFQMGEDEKLGYNPIEKYLKAKGLYQTLAKKTFSYQDANSNKEAIKRIAEWMGEQDSTVREYLEVMEVMDDYLDYLNYKGIYTQLDGREDQSIQLTRWLNNFYGAESAKAFDGYRDDDVDDLRVIAYDYIRIKYEGKQFRHLAYGLRENHFFGDKEIWTSFRDFHFEQKKSIIEEKIDLNSQNLERHLNDRDNKFYELSKFGKEDSFLKENDENHYTWLRNKQSAGQPEKLVKNALRSLESINQKHKSFKSPEVSKELEALNDFAATMISNCSVDKLFSHIIKLLEGVKISKATEEKDQLIEKAKTIQRIVYQMTREI